MSPPDFRLPPPSSPKACRPWLASALFLAVLLCHRAPPLAAQSVVVALREGYEDETISVPVSAGMAPGIAALACRVAFDTASLDVTATSTFFGTFAEQYRLGGVAAPMAVTATIGGETFDAPFLVRPLPSGLGIAGARRLASANPSPVLFTLHVSLKPGAAPGFYPLDLDATAATAPQAGYPPGGESVPLLVGYDSVNGIFPVIAAITPGGDPAVDGSARFFPADTDRDGLADAWELNHYPDLPSANATTDSDRDGLSAILEQAFASNPHAPNGNLVSTASLDGDTFTLRFPLLDHASIAVEWSTDTIQWFREGITLIRRPDLGSGPDWAMHLASIARAQHPRLFLRVSARPAPEPAP